MLSDSNDSQTAAGQKAEATLVGNYIILMEIVLKTFTFQRKTAGEVPKIDETIVQYAEYPTVPDNHDAEFPPRPAKRYGCLAPDSRLIYRQPDEMPHRRRTTPS